MLHIINQSPFNRSCLADCLRICDAQAAIVLIEDGVYAAINGSAWAQRIIEQVDNVYVLQADVDARGLTGKIADPISAIDYAGFVQLCCAHTNSHSWY